MNFGFDGAHGTNVRPVHKVAVSAWAKDESAPGANDGTRLTASWANRITAQFRALSTRFGFATTETSDADLGDAIVAAVAAEVGDTTLQPDDIVNGLASTDATKVLSAAQGKVLKDLIDGLGDVIVIANVTARNALTGLDPGDLVHVIDDGAGKWVRYQVTAAGNGTWAGATKVVIWTQDQAPTTHAHPISDVTGLQTALDAKAPLASPALTGTPTAPTASPGTNTTQIASTAFVTAAIAAGGTVVATQTEAEAGTNNTVIMTPLRTAQAIASDLTVTQLMLEIADLQNIAQFLGPNGNRFADSFDALTFVNTGAATNLDTGTAGRLRPTRPAGADQIPAMIAATTSGVTISCSNENGSFPSWRVGDNSNSTDFLNLTGNTAFTLQVDFGAGNEKVIVAHTMTELSATNYVAARYPASFTLDASNNGSSWTTLDTQTGATVAAGNKRTFSFSNSTAFRYYRWSVAANGSGNLAGWAECELLLAGTPNNLTVAAQTLTAAAAPTQMRAVVRATYVDTPTLNTDLMLDVSRDGGATWTTSTLSLAYTTPGSVRVLTTNVVDVSAQPSGTSPRWRIRTANNKMVEINDVYLYWS